VKSIIGFKMVSKVVLACILFFGLAVISADLNGQTLSNGLAGHEERAASTCSYFPNPVNDILHISVNAEGDKIYLRIELIDPIGRVIEEIILDRPEAYIHEIDVSTVPNGMYFIRFFKDDDTVEVERVQVSH